MSVDSKPGTNTNGATANGQRTKGGRRRPSSLMAVAQTLPTVEHSLEEFIAKEADAQRREADLNRMKAAEIQMRAGEAREQSLRSQLDGLQGKLAEAEARAAVAGAVGGASPEADAALA